MHNAHTKPEGFIDRSPKGVALRNGLSVTSVYNEIKAGRLSAKKMGKRTMITEAQEQAWIDAMPEARFPAPDTQWSREKPIVESSAI